jgi:enoyl-CoA hydratase/carnithine racemase
MTDGVFRERRGHVELLTINRPEVRNAVDRATSLVLTETLTSCESDDDVSGLFGSERGPVARLEEPPMWTLARLNVLL